MCQLTKLEGILRLCRMVEDDVLNTLETTGSTAQMKWKLWCWLLYDISVQRREVEVEVHTNLAIDQSKQSVCCMSIYLAELYLLCCCELIVFHLWFLSNFLIRQLEYLLAKTLKDHIVSNAKLSCWQYIIFLTANISNQHVIKTEVCFYN